MKGKVHFMAVNVEDSDLLTSDAAGVLRAAEVILHDDLVSQAILDLVPASTQVRSVGKLRGNPGVLQDKINAALVSAAREGHQVVRLKAGDPRASEPFREETEVLAQEGIEFEVVTAVASAMGATAGANSR